MHINNTQKEHDQDTIANFTNKSGQRGQSQYTLEESSRFVVFTEKSGYKYPYYMWFDIHFNL